MSDGENGTSNGAEFDFTPIGQAIKKARETNGITREQLVTMFDISVDQYIFPEKKSNKSTRRRQIDSLLDTLDDRELSVIEATANSLCKAKEQTEE
mgnify:CR=1 FL=1